jgi:urease accessory protein UreF
MERESSSAQGEKVGDQVSQGAAACREQIAVDVVEGYKRYIRKGVAPGHLAVCWGVMTAGLGLSLGES